MATDFRQVKVTTKEAACANCKKPLPPGSTALASFHRDFRSNRSNATFVCDEFCLADLKTQKDPDSRFLDKLATQFN